MDKTHLIYNYILMLNKKLDQLRNQKRMNDIFEQRKIGRPIGTEERQHQYFESVKSNKTSRKSKTLDYCGIRKDENDQWINDEGFINIYIYVIVHNIYI